MFCFFVNQGCFGELYENMINGGKYRIWMENARMHAVLNPEVDG